jgi:hypothetical protein
VRGVQRLPGRGDAAGASGVRRRRASALSSGGRFPGTPPPVSGARQDSVKQISPHCRPFPQAPQSAVSVRVPVQDLCRVMSAMGYLMIGSGIRQNKKTGVAM